MRFGDFKFRFRWGPTLLLALPVPVFIALGFWQLDRAEQKRELADILDARSDLPAYALGGPVEHVEELRFRRLSARGRYEPEGQIVLESRRHGGRNGFHVVTPLRLENSDIRVLVNRGWIPADRTGQPAEAPIPEGIVEVTGQTHIPALPPLVLHGSPDAVAAWGGRWPYLTVELYAAIADYPLQPLVLLLDPDNAGGFVRNWPKELPKQGMHVGYALQWFAFAIIAIVIYLRLSLERRDNAGVNA